MNIFFNDGNKEQFEIKKEEADEVIEWAKKESNAALRLTINNNAHLIFKNSIKYINFQ